jgi:membrane-bound lytic murein transglycosylase B
MRAMRVWMGILAVLVVLTATAGEPASYSAGAKHFASDMASRHGLDEMEVIAVLRQARYQQAIVDAIRRPSEAKPWYKYRPIFLTDKRTRGGVAFWRKHRELLERARAAYGVPPQIITAIIGVETQYGDNLGKHRVIDALTTLGFSYPERQDFFRGELEEFLVLTRDESIDALGAKGSYAGAMGLPQFIPSSYRAYAVDFDRDGQRDLWGSPADAVGSVGNYLRRHGWLAGQPVACEARVVRGVPKGISLSARTPQKPDTSVGRLRAAGITAKQPLEESTRVALIRLEAPEPEYWLGLENFYVITRYNHSNLYAMAVYQLSREIQAKYEAESGKQAAHHKFGDWGK